jgi:hypothetical protein
VLALVLVGATIPPLVSKIEVNHKISAAQEPWKGVTDSIEGRALVIVQNSGPYLMHLNPYSFNTPKVDGRIVFAVDRGADNLQLIGKYPHRTPYLERTTDPAFDDPVGYHDAPIPRISLVPVDVIHGRTLTLRERITTTTADPIVAAYVQIGDKTLWRTLSTTAKAGDVFETEWTVAAAGAPEVARGAAVGLDEPLGAVNVGFYTRSPDRRRRAEHYQEFEYGINKDDGTLNVIHPGRAFTTRTTNGVSSLRAVGRVPGFHVDLTTDW